MQAPRLKDFRKTRQVELPSYPGSQVEIYDGALFGQAQAVGNAEQHPAEALLIFIKGWNFVQDDAGTPLPLNADTIKQLNISDVEFLGNAVTAFVEERKKA